MADDQPPVATAASSPPHQSILPSAGPEPATTSDFDSSERDSAYGDTDSTAGTDSSSLISEITKYRQELGRTFHNYGSTEHWGPNDEAAQDQQDLSHHLWTLTLHGKSYLAPLKEEDSLNVLDLGTGTGIWAIDVAEAHPRWSVKGIDVSPIQPSWVPPNLKFEADDYNLDWLDEEVYDYVHGRELLGSVPDWVAFFKKAYKALKPGGWVEEHEPSIFIQTDYNTFDDKHPFAMWGPLMVEAGRKANLDFHIAHKVKAAMEEAGFTNVTEVRSAWPIGRWAKGRHMRDIGKWNYLRVDTGINDFCARRFHHMLGWKKEEIDVFCARIRNDLKNDKFLIYQAVYFVYGQKPA